MHQGAVTLKADGAIAYANGRLHDLLALEQGRLVGSPFASHLTDAAVPIYQALMESARNGGGEAELDLRRSDGSVFPALVTSARLFRHTEII